MAKYKKKPVVIEAWPVASLCDIAENCHSSLPPPILKAIEGGIVSFRKDCIFVETLEGNHKGNYDDMLIQGVAGELYPCKPDIFAKTYDFVSE